MLGLHDLRSSLPLLSLKLQSVKAKQEVVLFSFR
jgi:hypothetical protein